MTSEDVTPNPTLTALPQVPDSKQVPVPDSFEQRALSSGGTNSRNRIQFAISGLETNVVNAKSILDIGCGKGHLGEFLRQSYKGRLDGMDIVSYEDFLAGAYDHLILANLNDPVKASDSLLYDMIFAIEVIEHLENPRAFVRFCTSQLQPGGKLIVTTPNVISVSSLLTLTFQGHFRDFRDGIGMYPAHLSPIIPLDAKRIVQESGLQMISINYSNNGRIPFTTKTYQRFVPFLKGKLFSDNYRIVAIKP